MAEAKTSGKLTCWMWLLWKTLKSKISNLWTNPPPFTFDLAGESVGNGYPYPHISIKKDIDLEKKDGDKLYYIYKFYFHNIKNEFSQEWIDNLKATLNAEEVSVVAYDDPDTFEGTLLKISCWYEPGLKVKIDLPDSR